MTVEEFYNQEANKKPFTESIFKNTRGVTWKDDKPQQNVIHATDEMLAFAEAYHQMRMNESDGTGLTPANKKKMPIHDVSSITNSTDDSDITRCPKCGSSDHTMIRTQPYKCNDCGTKFL